MGLFSKFRKQKRDEIPENAGCPYSPDVPEVNRFGTKRSYYFKGAPCTVSGDISRLRVGSVVYTARGNTVRDYLRNDVATIDNPKIAKMIDDYLKKENSITARVAKIDGKLYINIGFYKEPKIEDEDEDNEADT